MLERQDFVGFTTANPPSRVGRANRSRTAASGGALPVKAGMKVEDRNSSSGAKRETMLGVVCER